MPNVIDVIKDPKRLKEIFGSTPTKIGDLRVDILYEEIPDLQWDIPEQRVDVGVDVADSRYQLPVGVTLDCALLDPEYSITNYTRGEVAGESFENDDWRTKRDKLLGIIGQNELITILTPSEIDYSDMMVTSLVPDFRPETRNYFRFRVTAKRVIQVSSEVRGIDQGLIPEELKKKKNDQANKKQGKKKNKGTKKTVDSNERKKSILKSLYDKGLGALG